MNVFQLVKIVLPLCAGLALPAYSQSTDQTCEAKADIIALADLILAKRSDLPGYSTVGFGTTATYLKLNYQEMGAEDGQALLAHVASQTDIRPKFFQGLTAAFLVSKLGIRAGLNLENEDWADETNILNFETARAIILIDGGKTFFKLVAILLSDPENGEKFRIDFSHFKGFLINVLLDQNDQFLQGFAQLAEDAGEIRMAATILSGVSDLSGLVEIHERYPENRELMVFAALGSPGYIPGVFRQRRESLVSISTESPAQKAERQYKFDIMAAAFHSGASDYLLTLLNRTGMAEPISKAATAFLEAVDSGELYPDIDFGPGWLLQYDVLFENMDREILSSTLGKIRAPTSLRHFSGSVLDTLDWLVAKRAIAGLVQENGAFQTERPSQISDGFAWDVWVEHAQALHGAGIDGMVQLPSFNPVMAAELLVQSGRLAEAIQFAGEHMDIKPELAFYRDIMTRLDRGCAGYSAFPGQAFALAGLTVFRFDNVAQ